MHTVVEVSPDDHHTQRHGDEDHTRVVVVGGVTPSAIDPDDAAAAGSSTTAAAADHQHAIVAATAGVIEPDDAAAEGAATSFARSDHKHSIVAAVAGAIAPDDTAAEGTATSFARSDHRHSIAAAAPEASEPADVIAEGVSTSFARSDHKHGRESSSTARVNTNQTRGLTSYGDLTTVGPSVTMVTDTSVNLSFSCAMNTNSAGAQCFVAVAVSGATTRAAADGEAIYLVSFTASIFQRGSMVINISGLTGGTNTFTLKYRVSAGTGSFADRELTVERAN